jgi:hypothetical protein
VADDDQYVLRSDSPDVDFAARFQVEHNIRNDHSLSSPKKQDLLAVIASLSASA